MNPPSVQILTGQTDSHVCALEDSEVLIHRDAVADFLLLKQKAQEAGFDIGVISGFRGFEAQQRIWDLKATGQRALLDDGGNPLVFEALTPKEIVFSILRWSALPGASRHHWGTELDVYPTNLSPQYQVKLIPQEIESGGVYEPFGNWLKETLPALGFFRPYQVDLGGVNPEWWHISYAPISDRYFNATASGILKTVVEQSSIQLKSIVIQHWDEIFERFVTRITLPDPQLS